MAPASGRAEAVALAALVVLVVGGGALLAAPGPPTDGGAGPDAPAATATPTPPAESGAGSDSDAAATPTPAPGSEPTGTPTTTAAGTSTPTPTPTPVPQGDGGAGDSGGGSGSGGGSDGSSDGDDDGEARFDLVVEEVAECGTRCRDVTATLTNVGDADAEDVDVRTRLLAGGVELWTGEVAVGDVPAGESATRTQRVTVGFLEAARIRANDGVVTVETTVTWDGGSRTVSEREDVL
jgi:hypothetical protein